MLTRRLMLTGPLLAGTALAGTALASPPAAALDRDAAFQDGVAALERRHGGRLGAAVLDAAGTLLAAHRGEERFPLCSTYKLLAAACALARVDRGEDSLARQVAYAREDLVTYSPVTERHAGAGGMTLGALCGAAVTLSDNTAGNLLLDSLGGPAALTAWLRGTGDGVTRLDRRETALNEAQPGDPRDTTTPAAMARTVQRTVTGNALLPASRAQLAAWLIDCRTGDKRLRAGAPSGWRAGDKTGSGANNTANDVAVFWPASGAPVVVAAYYTESTATEDERNAVLAEIGRLAAKV